MRFDTQQSIDNTGSHIISMQFCRNATGHKVSVNTFQHIQTQAKPRTATQRITANRWVLSQDINTLPRNKVNHTVITSQTLRHKHGSAIVKHWTMWMFQMSTSGHIIQRPRSPPINRLINDHLSVFQALPQLINCSRKKNKFSINKPFFGSTCSRISINFIAIYRFFWFLHETRSPF